MLNSTFPYFGTATLDFPTERNKYRRYIEWKDGNTPFDIIDDIKRDSDALARVRREKIKAAMEHAWGGYKKYAFGEDEVHPISGNSGRTSGMMNSMWGQESNSGIGITLIDSLDTLWIMGMKKEFWEARDWVRDNLKQDIDVYRSVFETTIRNLGGLLSAYELSGDKTFLDKAKELGDKLILAFNSKNGIPLSQVNLYSSATGNKAWEKVYTSLADSALQVEFRSLSKMTGNATYAKKAEYVIKALEKITPPSGIHSVFVNNLSKHPKMRMTHYLTKVTFGGLADSFFEYLLKTWLQGGKKEDLYRSMYDRAVQGLHNDLIYYSSPSGLLLLREKHFVVKHPKKKRARQSRNGRRRRKRKNGVMNGFDKALDKEIPFKGGLFDKSITEKNRTENTVQQVTKEEIKDMASSGKRTLKEKKKDGNEPETHEDEVSSENNKTAATWRPTNNMDHLACFAAGELLMTIHFFLRKNVSPNLL